MERLPSWEVLFHMIGDNLENAGKLLKDGGIELSISDLQDVRDGLRAMADSLDQRINVLKEDQ